MVKKDGNMKKKGNDYMNKTNDTQASNPKHASLFMYVVGFFFLSACLYSFYHADALYKDACSLLETTTQQIEWATNNWMYVNFTNAFQLCSSWLGLYEKY